MSHLIEQMAYQNQTPWHGLGNRLNINQPLEVWAQQSGISFDIKETPVRFAYDGTDESPDTASFPDHKVLYRSDTLAPLSVVSQRYQVVQPREILEFYRDLTEISGFELETAGVMKGGRKIWALARTSQSATIKGNDTLNGYLLLATACDGTLATTAQFTSIRVVCNNTLAVALSNSTGAVKVPHSTSFDPVAIKRQLGISASDWETFIYRMKLLAGRRVKATEAADYFLRVFTEPAMTASGLANERAMKKAMALYEGNGKGSGLASSKGTAFGLLNSVTEYVDHERQARSVDNRLESAWFGQGAVLKQKAFEQAMLMPA